MGCLRRLSERSECVPKAMSKKRRMGCEPRVIEDFCVATKGRRSFTFMAAMNVEFHFFLGRKKSEGNQLAG